MLHLDRLVCVHVLASYTAGHLAGARPVATRVVAIWM
jgi:hypothetical protein